MDFIAAFQVVFCERILFVLKQLAVGKQLRRDPYLQPRRRGLHLENCSCPQFLREALGLLWMILLTILLHLLRHHLLKKLSLKLQAVRLPQAWLKTTPLQPQVWLWPKLGPQIPIHGVPQIMMWILCCALSTRNMLMSYLHKTIVNVQTFQTKDFKFVKASHIEQL